MNSVVQFKNVSKRYNLGLTRTSVPAAISQWLRAPAQSKPSSPPNAVLWALKDVSFALGQGESLALVGPNGAGKTTILKLLANIIKPTSGRLTIKGKLSALIELGAGFHPDLTGRENVFLNGTILGLRRKEIERRFDEIVSFSELGRFIDTPVKRYSSGMVVRLGFAVASCIEPDILLVDEVLAVGDASFQQKCLKRIRSLISGGTSIVFVSHNLYLVQAACNTALYLREGQLRNYGATKDVFGAYEQDLHEERARKFDASHTAEKGENNDVEITRVEVLSTDGPAAEALPSDRPARMRIHYNAYTTLGKVQVSAFIVRSDGVLCCMMRTRLSGFDLYLERGQGVIEVQLTPLQLVGGAYYAEVWFLDETDSMNITARAGRSDWFTVRGAALSFNESSVYEPITCWRHYRDGASSASKLDGQTTCECGSGCDC